MLTDNGAVPDKPLSLSALSGNQFEKIKKKFLSEHFPLFYIHFDPRQMDELKEELCALRADNLSFILLIDNTAGAFNIDSTIDFLRTWDSLLLKNLFKLFPQLEDPIVQKHLRAEATIELLWFREWNLALCDNRIGKYPNLPWRSYLRRVNTENYNLAKALLKAMPEDLPQILLDFLESRKKVVCLFPKNWSKS